MADDITTPETESVPDSVQYTLDMTKAGLSHDEAVQLEATVAPHLAEGTLDENDIFHAQFDAVAAHDSYEHAKAEQHEEALAAGSGDFAHAAEHGINAGYDLHQVEDSGGASAHPTIDALQGTQDHHVQALEYAAWEASTAHEYAADAAASADSGHHDAAAASADSAAAHHDDAAAHGGDAGHHDDSSFSAAEPAAAAEMYGETAG